jgi:hypothetical protein
MADCAWQSRHEGRGGRKNATAADADAAVAAAAAAAVQGRQESKYILIALCKSFVFLFKIVRGGKTVTVSRLFLEHLTEVATISFELANFLVFSTLQFAADALQGIPNQVRCPIVVNRSRYIIVNIFIHIQQLNHSVPFIAAFSSGQ